LTNRARAAVWGDRRRDGCCRFQSEHYRGNGKDCKATSAIAGLLLPKRRSSGATCCCVAKRLPRTVAADRRPS